MSVLVGHKAPDFTAAAVLANGEIVETFKLHEAINNKYGLLFFYPLDFTFVCPSELIAVDHRIEKFKQLNVEIIGISVDSAFCHHAYRQRPVNEGGIGPVQYTLVSDISHGISQSYGIEHPEGKVALRAAFLIDTQGVVRAQHVNDLPLGRNVDELLRLVEALQFHEEHGEVCPAGWQQGSRGMRATPEGVADYLAGNAEEL